MLVGSNEDGQLRYGPSWASHKSLAPAPIPSTRAGTASSLCRTCETWTRTREQSGVRAQVHGVAIQSTAPQHANVRQSSVSVVLAS